MWRCSVAECIVHGREFCLHILLAETNQLKCLDHDLRVMVTNRTGGKLYAVAHQIVLVSKNRKRLLVAECVHTALRHGERVVAEFQLSGLLADLIHREIYDPAEFVAILFHVLLARSAKQSAEYACGLLRCQLLAGGQTDKVTRL